MKSINKDRLLGKLLLEVKDNEDVSKRLNEKELLEMVYEKFDNVGSKSMMLKMIREDGFSVSMNRCYEMYRRIENEIKKEK